MRKSTFCIDSKTKAQISFAITDQRLCFHCTYSTVSLLSKSEISSLSPSFVLEQLGLCWTCSETTLLVFSRRGYDANIGLVKFQ